MTTEPDPDNRRRALHPRLTVVRAGSDNRRELAGRLGEVVLGPADLAVAAQGHFAQRWSDRMAARARLDGVASRSSHDAVTAASRLEHLQRSRAALLQGADWAERSHDALPGLRAAVEEARQHLEQQQAAQRTVIVSLERVLEQRAAASAAIAEADHELAGLGGASLDETELRRELEASGDAVRVARSRHEEARAHLEALEAERDQLDLEGEQPDLGAPGEGPVGPEPSEHDIDRVRARLSDWRHAARDAGPDPDAARLADAFEDLRADLEELGRSAGPHPDEQTLLRAEQQVEQAAARLDALDSQMASRAITAQDRAELDAAHDTVERAAAATERRIGASSARRRLADAQEAERVLLERFGFSSHLEVVVSGGRATVDSPERLAASRALLAATSARDGLRAALRRSPVQEHLFSEEARLQAHARELLGVDAGDDVVPLLRAHPNIAPEVVDGLREALEAVGLTPIGVPLDAAAQLWLDECAAGADSRRRAEATDAAHAARRAAAVARRTELEAELTSARHAVSDSAEQLELAVRSVGTLEAELAERLGEDVSRVQRFAAAEQLRGQVKALSGTLGRAEKAARERVDVAAADTARAERSFDAAHAALSDLAREARQLAGELPIDQRPSGDPLTTLLDLPPLLRAHTHVLDDEIADAVQAASAASVLAEQAAADAAEAGPGTDPWPEDVLDGLRSLLGADAGVLSVLDDPLTGVDANLRPALLEAILERSETGRVVLLTDDPRILSWAIELPVEAATIAPADVLLNLGGYRADTETTDSSPIERSRT